MIAKLTTYFLPKGLDVTNWTAYSQSRYLIYGHIITILIATLGIIVNIHPFDVGPFFIDTGLILVLLVNLFLLQWSLWWCRFNFYLLVWIVIAGLATIVNPQFGYEYYFMIWSVSAVMLFNSKATIYSFFAIGVCSFYLPKLLLGIPHTEFNFNPLFLFLMLLLIFLVFYHMNKYYVELISKKNSELETDKTLIQQQANRIKEVSALQTRFFTNISHEIRTPLTLILGPIMELITHGDDLKQAQLKSLRTADQNARRLLNLVDEILELAKLESGHIRMEWVREDLSRFLQECMGMFQSICEQRKITLRFQAQCQECYVWFDKSCIEKITVNLLTNAIKYSSEGDHISVNLSCTNTGAIIKVKDTGRGIDPEILPHIFERFYHTQSEVQESSGIGLSIVKMLLEQIGGSIEVSSTIGVGSTFTISLPHSNPQPNHATTSVQSGAVFQELSNSGLEIEGEERREDTKKTILVVEDNNEVREFMKDILTPYYVVHTASSGNAGIKIAIEEIPDIILCDVMMPGKDGLEVTSNLKANELTSHIPIIMLTAKADTESMIKGLAVHADEYLVKPFEKKVLLARIANLLENRKRLKEALTLEGFITSDNIKVSSVDKQFVKRIMSLVERHMAEETFTVEQLAKEAGISRSQLHRKLTAITGKSPIQILRSRRLQKARQMLMQNVGTIAEIAYKSGFSSPNYFSTCFVEEFGCRPGEIRNRT